MTFALDTPRLRLRHFAATEADAAELTELHNDPDVMRHLNGGQPVSPETVRGETLPRMLRSYPCMSSGTAEPFGGHPGFWAAEETAGTRTGRFLGWFEFRPLEEDSSEVVELGYRLHKSAWGRGYATEGSRALIRRGFTELGVQRVTANTMAVNTASRRVMEKSGLQLHRTFFPDWPDPLEGSEHGEVEYTLARADWLGTDPPPRTA
ncbi:GNAT family N-acetyltransferase [Streptomyces sp. N2-109]|uniref:GNAT family N-acetyltransferase n=1 Tax=Streptomyces gossypii TaxID=2883101 RepID=A0ABT2JRH4_9ACTN|nr:GNAT family N-acetyltransferase [Streptomyces gossypii]MCT2590488.1 GNAT family N-acetyltransferase [Streptomyces gossypii]